MQHVDLETEKWFSTLSVGMILARRFNAGGDFHISSSSWSATVELLRISVVADATKIKRLF